MQKKRFTVAPFLIFVWLAGPAVAQDVRPESAAAPAGDPSQQQAPIAVQIHDRFRGFQDLLSLGVEERRGGLEELLAGTHEDLGVLAARQLITDESPGAEAKIVTHVSQWSERNQIVLLESLRFRPGADLEIPRAILRRYIEKPSHPDYNQHPASAVDLAAILISRQPGASDGDLILQALRANPTSRGPWLAGFKLGLISPVERDLAMATLHDTDQPLVVRATAATVLAATDSAAEQFLEQSIRSEFDGQASLNAGLRKAFEQLAMVGLIEFMPSQPADRLLAALLAEPRGALDSAIRAVALLRAPQRVAAEDVPEDLRAYVMQARSGLYLGF